MTDRERVKLLFGPYTPPKLKRDDRANCLVRDCTVVITSISAGRIPWPRPRARDQRGGGGSGLLVDEELARAVRSEPAAAVMYWWGVGVHAVWRWRKALGVGRMDSPGRRRLILAAGEAGAAVLRETHRRKSRMVEISLSGSGEGPGWVTSRGYATPHFKPSRRPHFGEGDRRIPAPISPPTAAIFSRRAQARRAAGAETRPNQYDLLNKPRAVLKRRLLRGSPGEKRYGFIECHAERPPFLAIRFRGR